MESLVIVGKSGLGKQSIYKLDRGDIDTIALMVTHIPITPEYVGTLETVD